MTKKQIRLFEFVFVVVAILVLILSITGCTEVESKYIVDYRYNAPRTDVVTDYNYKWNWHEDEYQLVPDTHTKYVPESYELMWEIRYDNGHVSREWQKCTRFEYDNAVKELGDINETDKCRQDHG